jgi:DNA-binding NarL/FixJ family response regulator
MKYSVIIVDDHEVVRFGLRTLLQSEFHVVAEASDGLEALRAIERFKPDVLTLDISLPGLSGLEVARETARVSPGTRALMVSMHTNESYVAQALRNGAFGYIRKDAKSEELLAAVRGVATGKRYIDSAISQSAIVAHITERDSEGFDPLECLSSRERQILQLTAEGHSAAAIGERLFISPRTVETHRASIMRKLGLHTHTDLILFAIRHGLVSVV